MVSPSGVIGAPACRWGRSGVWQGHYTGLYLSGKHDISLRQIGKKKVLNTLGAEQNYIF